MAIPFIGAILDVIKGPLDKLIPDKNKRMAFEHEIATAAMRAGFAQMEINKVEAAHKSLFVAGWRPFVGWVCGLGLAYAAIIEPIMRFVVKVYFPDVPIDEIPKVGTDILMPTLMGMLGLGGLRTYEKKLGLARER
ncbi:MAG: holin family protein [Kordiimonadaceae bacterium]|nr:holin family protein [Kordiimonadaceae bacterium]